MKSKTFKKTKKVGDNTLVSIFNQMTGTEDADPIIIESKFDNIRKYLSDLLNAWRMFYNSPLTDGPKKDFKKGFKEIYDFLNEGLETMKTNLKEETSRMKTNFQGSLFEELYEMGTKYNAKELNVEYKKLRKSNTLKHCLITLNNLKSLLDEDKRISGDIFSCLDLENNMSNRFIVKTNLDTKILSFSCLDFKMLYDAYDNLDMLILTALRITYLTANEIYKIFISPDIDIDKLISAFRDKLKSMKNVIPGCDKAFKCLEKSLKLLKNNFSNYYKKFMVTNNPGIIFETFLADVAEKNKGDPTIMVQFKKITAFIKKNMPVEVRNNPQVGKLWDISDKLFENFGKTTIPNENENEIKNENEIPSQKEESNELENLNSLLTQIKDINIDELKDLEEFEKDLENDLEQEKNN